MEVRSPQPLACTRLRLPAPAVGFVVSNRWMEHQGFPRSSSPLSVSSCRCLQRLSEPVVGADSQPGACAIPVSGSFSRGRCASAARTRPCLVCSHPKARTFVTARSHRGPRGMSPTVPAFAVRPPSRRGVLRPAVSPPPAGKPAGGVGPVPPSARWVRPAPDIGRGRVSPMASPPRPRIIYSVRQRTVRKKCSLGAPPVDQIGRAHV